MIEALSIVIVNWNAKEALRSLVKSILLHKDNFNLEITVVDNNSSDGSISMLEEEFPFIAIIRNEKNLGFAKANNQGVKNSKANKVLLLNPDTELRSGSLEYLAELLNKNAAAGMVGPKIVGKNGRLQRECARNFPGPLTEFLLTVPFVNRFSNYYMRDADYNLAKKVPCISGAAMMLRKKLFDETGGFDERFFMYGEDMDLCFKMNKLGHEIWYVPQSEILHLGGVSTGQKLRLESCKSMALFLKKNRGMIQSVLYRFLLSVYLLYFVFGALFFCLFKINRQHYRKILTENLHILLWAATSTERDVLK